MSTTEVNRQDLSGYVIRYVSPFLNEGISLVWYTDTDENKTDKLLTYTDGKIFAVENSSGLYDAVVKERDLVDDQARLLNWAKNWNENGATVNVTYDLNQLIRDIEGANYSSAVLKDFVNFINLFNDFAAQEEQNEHLLSATEDELINRVYNYWYETNFWAKIDGSSNNDASGLQVDTDALLIKLKDLATLFESYIVVK